MNENTFRKYIYALPAICLFVIIVYHAYTNNTIIYECLDGRGIDTMDSFSEELEQKLKDGLIQKNYYINLCGFAYDIFDINTLNYRQRLKNGWLANLPQDSYNFNDLVDRIKKLSDFLSVDDIEFLHLFVPEKSISYDAECELGYECDGHDAVLRYSNTLNGFDINNINMERWFEDNGWGIEDIYFKTDHHWKPEAAFEATREIMKWLSAMDDTIIYNESSLSEDNWHKEIYTAFFLGSEGKRTGSQYVGVDDISYIFPIQTTDVSVDRVVSTGLTDRCNMNSVYYKQRIDEMNYFNENPYAMYIGADYPLVYIRNRKAENNKKVIVVGDSFRLPVECFLSTQFSEIYHIDMRNYHDGTFTEFVKQIQPDVVLCVVTISGDINCHRYGITEWIENFQNKKEFRSIAHIDTIELEPALSKYDSYIVKDSMEAGAYEVNIADVTMTRDRTIEPEFPGSLVQASVINLLDNSAVCTRYFISDYGEPQKWLFTIPEDEEANYAIVIYNGINGDTRGNTIRINDFDVSIAMTVC